MVDLQRIVGVLLVDPRGWVLLQERDEHALIAPNQWGVVGGHVEPGEDWVAARDRELHEETALTLADGTLELWWAGVVEHEALGSRHDWRLWVGAVDLTDDDITCGEGKQIVFVDPATFDRLHLSASLARFLPEFVGSSAYARLSLNP